MNEEAQKILLDLLKKAANGIDSAVAFSQQQIPDVVNQLLVWNAVSSALIQALCFIVMIVAVAICVKAWRKWYDADAIMLMTAVSFVSCMIAIMVFSVNFDWLKIWLAPKLYLIEYAASLVK